MAMAEAWEVTKRAIEAYAGLSPAAFFTVLAAAAALYYTMAGFLAPPPPPPQQQRTREAEPLLPPVEIGEIAEEELRAYDGSDPKKPLLMAIKGQIYDVTQSRMFYGPGGPYALFAGKDASRALAKMSFEPKDLTGDISGLGPFELEALRDWEYKFMSKYVKVGTIKKAVPVTDGSDASTSEITEKSNQNVESADRQVEQIAETREDGPAESSAKAKQNAESKEDGTVGHGNKAGQAELKEKSSSGHSVEGETDHNAILREAGAGEGSTE